MEGVLAILMIFGIPITAIICSTYIKSKKLNMQNGTDKGMQREFMELRNENRRLRERVENLELIVSDPDLLGTKAGSDANARQISDI